MKTKGGYFIKIDTLVNRFIFYTLRQLSDTVVTDHSCTNVCTLQCELTYQHTQSHVMFETQYIIWIVCLNIFLNYSTPRCDE